MHEFRFTSETERDGMKTIGMIINPVAGMGGAVGLKGTDGEMYQKALELGAQPVAPDQARDFLQHINRKDQIQFLAAPGAMGANLLREMALPYQVIGNLNGRPSNSADTITISREMVSKGADLIVFVGGDGTARDLYTAVGVETPVIAIPAGVKIFSGIFAVSARAAAGLLNAFLDESGFTTEEILDIDETAYRNNQLQSQLFGYMKTPQASTFLQHSKSASQSSGSELHDQLALAEWVVEKMLPDTLYLLGPGTTVKAITDVMGLQKTLLGVDALHNGEIILMDLSERDILALLEKYPQHFVIVTPIGGNGFIFGRGNKQFTAQVIRKIGVKNIIIVSTPGKVSSMAQLRVDTHDETLDQDLTGFRQVVIGYRESRMIKVV